MSLLYQATTKTSVEITEGAYNKVKLLFTSDLASSVVMKY